MPRAIGRFLKGIVVVALLVSALPLTGCRKYHQLEKEIPVYQGSEFERTFKDSSNKKEHELWIAEASTEDVSKYYQGQLEEKKWKKQMIVPSPDGSGYALAYTKGDKMLTFVIFARAGKKGETYIDLSVVKTSK